MKSKMKSVLIFGAGSIGNHLAYACTNKGWTVTIFDTDSQALERTRHTIYPQRYKKWDDSIRLAHQKDVYRREEFDLVIIGTPPDTHLSVATEVLSTSAPRVMLIEKPLCPPGLEGCHELISLAAQTGT